MQPYQKSSEEVRRQGELPLKLAKTAGSIASTGLGVVGLGSAGINRVLPLLNKYIPEDLAIKGLNKIDSRYGKFIQKALSAGKTIDEVKDFISEKAQEGKKPEERNMIQQYSPELNQFILDQLKNGRSVLEAGALAEMGGKFKKQIASMVKDHKAPWSSILQSIFSEDNLAKNDQEAQMDQQSKEGQQGKNQSGSGQQALMQMLEKINQRMGQ